MNELRRSASVLLALSLSAAACGDGDAAKNREKPKNGVSVIANAAASAAHTAQPYWLGTYDLDASTPAVQNTTASVIDDRCDIQADFTEDTDEARLLALADSAAQGHPADLFAYPWDDTADRYDFKQTWYDSEAIAPMFDAGIVADPFDEL